MIRHRSLAAGDVIINWGIQNDRLAVIPLDHYRGRAAPIQTHGEVSALFHQKFRKFGEGRARAVKRLAAVHDDEVKVAPVLVDADGGARLKGGIVESAQRLPFWGCLKRG